MPTDTLSITFAALADPTRRAILKRLSAGEATVSELASDIPRRRTSSPVTLIEA